MLGLIRIGAPAMALGICLGLLPQDRVAELRARFEREQDPVKKAKLMPALGAEEFQEIQKSVAAGNTAEALAGFRKYREEAQICAKELDSKAIDAENHPAGFKQLQLSLRQSLRRLEDVLVTLPGDDQKPFLELRHDLEQLDRHLILELFPSQPGAATEKPKKQP